MNSLSLSQRERIKVRDCFRNAAPARTKSHPEHYRVLPGPDGSRIAKRRFRDWRETSFALHRAFPGRCSYDRLHQARSRDELQDNRNLKHNNQSDVGAGTCSPRTSDFEDGATRSFHNASDSYVGSARESQGGRLSDKFGQRNNFHWLSPHLNPLPKLGRGKDLLRPRKRARHAAPHVRACRRRITSLHAKMDSLSLSQRERIKVRDCFFPNSLRSRRGQPETRHRPKNQGGALSKAPFFGRRFGNRRSLVAPETNSPCAQKDRKAADDRKTAWRNTQELEKFLITASCLFPQAGTVNRLSPNSLCSLSAPSPFRTAS
jgi:hypothetical protein